MKTMRFFLVLLLLLVGVSRAGFCQTETLSRFLQSNLKAKPLIVIEGDRNVDHEHPELLRILAGKTSLKEKIVAIGEKCDYEVKENEGAYLFYKRYTENEEMPCVTSEEVFRYNEDIARILDATFGEGMAVESTPLIHELLQSLSDADWELIQRDVLPVKALNPRSQQLFAGLLTQTYVGGLQHFCRIVNHYGAGMDRLRLEMAKDEAGRPKPNLLCRFYVKGISGDAHWFQSEPNDFYIVKSVVDKYTYLNASFSSSTLGDVLGQLNSKDTSPTLFKAEASLMKKPISVVGMDDADASPLQVLKGISLLYDLRLAVTSKEVKLSRKPVRLKPNMDMGQSMIVALPYPLRRMLGKRNHKEATAKYIYTLLPQVQKTKSLSLPVKDLARVYQTAITLYFFDDVLRAVRDNGMARLPRYLNNREVLYLRCRRSPGTPATLGFTILTNKNGKLVSGPDYRTSRDVPRN